MSFSRPRQMNPPESKYSDNSKQALSIDQTGRIIHTKTYLPQPVNAQLSPFNL